MTIRKSLPDTTIVKGPRHPLTTSNSCATCSLNTYSCPGHVGHIELPVPVYHVTYMDQLLLLLRAKCEFCGHLKLNPVEINRFTCKLRLIQYGLLIESQQLEDIQPTVKAYRNRMTNGANGAEGTDEEEESDTDDLQQKRNEFVKRAIKTAIRRKSQESSTADKLEAISEERRTVVKAFLATIRKTKICGLCKGCAR